MPDLYNTTSMPYDTISIDSNPFGYSYNGPIGYSSAIDMEDIIKRTIDVYVKDEINCLTKEVQRLKIIVEALENKVFELEKQNEALTALALFEK